MSLDINKVQRVVFTWTIRQPMLSQGVMVNGILSWPAPPVPVQGSTFNKLWSLLVTGYSVRVLNLVRSRAKAYRLAGAPLNLCSWLAARDFLEKL